VSCAPWDPTGCASDIAKSVAGDAFGSIAHDFGKVADSAINWLWAQTSTAAAVHLGGPGFELDVSIVVAVAGTVALALFVIQVITSTLRRDMGGLGRAGRGLVVAFIGGGLAIAVTNLLLGAVDALSAGVVQAATGGSITTLGHALLAGGTVSTVTTNPAGVILLSLAALAAVVMVWAALMVRKVLIVVSAVFAPIAFAGSLADITTAWVRRWIEVTAALIFSKLILVLIFLVGWGMLAKGVGQAGQSGPQTTTQAVSGLLVLALAGFAPWVALKMVHWTGDQFHHLHTMAATSTAGAQKALAAPQKVRPLAMAAMGAAGGAAAGAGEGAGAGGGAGPGAGPGAGAGPGSGAGGPTGRPGTGPAKPETSPAAQPGSGNTGGGRPGGDRPPPTPAPATGEPIGGPTAKPLLPLAVTSASAGLAASSPMRSDPAGTAAPRPEDPLAPPAQGTGQRWPARAPTWVLSERESGQP
jgi:hypothetical protein